LTSGAWLALALFAALYVVLVMEWVHRAVAAVLAAVAALAGGLISPAAARTALDLNTLLLLFGIMVLVALLERAGLFLRVARLGEAWGGHSAARLTWAFILLTAVVSAFLPNVTVVLMLAPIVITAAEAAHINPVPLLIFDVLASNLGGMATLVGDPPNILIGTAGSLTFVDFLHYVAPLAVLLVLLVAWVAVRSLRRQAATASAAMEPMAVAHGRQLGPLAVVFGLTLVAFVFQPHLGLPLGALAVLGAMVAVIVVGGDLDQVLPGIDWSTLIFFAGLFVVVGAMVQQGVVETATRWLLSQSFGAALPVVVMVGTAVLSAFLDNLPIVAAMIPLVTRVLAVDPGYGPDLWVALAIGAAVGGNATLYGAAANVVAGSLAKSRGYRLSFAEWARIGMPLTAALLAVSAGWMWLGGTRL
jgi:Na+/H+ antiporter NhaD/arsenite permease-like protein